MKYSVYARTTCLAVYTKCRFIDARGAGDAAKQFLDSEDNPLAYESIVVTEDRSGHAYVFGVEHRTWRLVDR